MKPFGINCIITLTAHFVSFLHGAAVFVLLPNHLEQYRHLFPHLEPSSDMDTFLMSSIKDDNRDVLDVFLQAGLSPEHRDQTGMSLLMHAVNFRSESVTSLLLAHDANPSALDSFGVSVLMHSVKSQANPGKIALIWNLIQHGADINYRLYLPDVSFEYSFFSLAVENNFSEIVEEFTCFLDLENINKYLDIAFRYGKTGSDIIYLLKLGADPNYVNPMLNMSLVSYLVLTCNLRQFKEACQYFTDENINRVEFERDNYTPLMYAIRNGKIRIAKYLYNIKMAQITEKQISTLKSADDSYDDETMEFLYRIRDDKTQKTL